MELEVEGRRPIGRSKKNWSKGTQTIKLTNPKVSSR